MHKSYVYRLCCGLSLPRDQVDAMLIKRLGLNRQAITWPIGANVA